MGYNSKNEVQIIGFYLSKAVTQYFINNLSTIIYQRLGISRIPSRITNVIKIFIKIFIIFIVNIYKC